MADAGASEGQPVRARKVPREDVRPQTVVERQETLSSYLIRRATRRRENFLLRSRTTTIRHELLRALFLTGCILFDLLVVPEAIFLFPGIPGWSVTAVGLVLAVWIEGRYYTRHFAVGSRPSSGP